MKTGISRRTVVKAGLMAGAVVPVFGLTARDARAAALTPLDPTDPLAKSLNFSNDSTKVDAHANPTYKPTQKCGNCAQFQGKPGDAQAACTIFPGHTVPVGGWCKVWAQKPGA
jgi:High potential iron-sulfur protein